jgi:hypothetical protein
VGEVENQTRRTECKLWGWRPEVRWTGKEGEIHLLGTSIVQRTEEYFLTGAIIFPSPGAQASELSEPIRSGCTVRRTARGQIDEKR